jgi:hypothetical protein
MVDFKELAPSKRTGSRRVEARYENGDVYRGEVDLFGVRSGFGRFVSARGEVVIGDWRDGEVDGLGLIRLTNYYVYEGKVKMGKPNGRGVGHNSQLGLTYCGDYMDGVTHGVGTIEVLHKSGKREVCRGNFVHGMLEGMGAHLYPSGDLYEGNFEDGLCNGEGKLTFADGGSVVGTFVDGKPDGPGVWHFDGYSQEGNNVNGLMQGVGTRRFERGNHYYVGEFKDNLRHGRGTLYCPGVGRLDATYEDDDRVGPASFEWLNGDRWEGAFKSHDLATGTKHLVNGDAITGKWRGFLLRDGVDDVNPEPLRFGSATKQTMRHSSSQLL